MTHSERQSRLCNTPNPSRSRTLSSSSQDYRSRASRGTWHSAEPSSFHPAHRIRVGGSQMVTSNQTVFFSAPAYNHNDLVIYDPSMQASGSVIHFPRWTCVEPRRARGYDLPVVRERPHLNRVCKLQKRDVPLSRGDMGVEQHKRHKTFMRAVCDVFYHSQSRAVGRVLAFPCSPSFPE